MTTLARGYSFVMYAASAGATYTVPFPFLDASHVRVFAGDTDDALEETFSWVGPTEIALSGSVPEGILVTVRRFTPRGATMVSFQPSAQLPAEDLNLNSKQLLYIVQEQIDFGTQGGAGLPGGGVGWPTPGQSDPSLPIQEIIDKLMQSPTLQLLMARIEPIDELGDSLLQEILRSDEVFDYRRSNDARVASVETSITTIKDDQQSMAQRVDDVYAKYDDAEAQIRNVDQALSDEKSATATSFEGVNARMDQAESDITEVKQSVVDERSARSSDITKVEADYKAADDSQTQAIYQHVADTYTTPDQAQSIASTQVEAWAGGDFAMLQERFEALVDGSADPDSDPKWQANWNVRINAGQIDGTPVVAGIGLGVDSDTGSSFVVMTDRFAFVSPSYTSTEGVKQLRYPFVIGTVGGQADVGINGQLMVDGTITADKIKATSLSAISANLGEVNGGTFKTHTLDANGNVTNPNEFRVEITNKTTDNYPLWIGSGAKNENNSVFFVTRSGDAKFNGEVAAANLVDQLQVYSAPSWSGSIQGSSGGATSSFSLPAPVRPGDSHVPMLQLSVGVHNSHSSEFGDMSLQLQRLDGGNWVTIRQQIVGLNHGETHTLPILLADARTTAKQTYRLLVVETSGRSEDLWLDTLNGYIFGLK